MNEYFELLITDNTKGKIEESKTPEEVEIVEGIIKKK